MKDVFVVEAQRTPFGSFGGSLAEVSAPVLASQVIDALLRQIGLAGADVSEVILGQVFQGGCAQGPARQAMRLAGVPDHVPAMTINKLCGSGLKAIMLGADSIQVGNSEIVLAGGMENMSQTPFVLKKARYGYRMGHGELLDLMLYDGLIDPESGRHMGEITEMAVARHSLSREAQDEFAIGSYQRAQQAIKEGVIAAEIVPVVKPGKGGTTTVDRDEEPFKVDYDRFTSLRPVFKKDGTITAANASTINDGAAVALLASGEAVKKHGLRPKARVVAHATCSMHPEYFTDAPVGAIKAACDRAELKLSDIDLFEVNEAFAAVTLIAIKELGLDAAKVNVNGGACAIGHPVGASGGRLVATLVRELHARKKRYGLATLCIGGGEAVAVVLETV